MSGHVTEQRAPPRGSPEGVKPCRSECRYSDVESRFVFSAVLSVNGLRERPRPLSRSVDGMLRAWDSPRPAMASMFRTFEKLFLQHFVGQVIAEANGNGGNAVCCLLWQMPCWHPNAERANAGTHTQAGFASPHLAQTQYLHFLSTCPECTSGGSIDCNGGAGGGAF